jgi:Domain of unknown function (DUF4260)
VSTAGTPIASRLASLPWPRHARRLAYAVLAAALTALALLAVLGWRTAWWQAVTFGLAPDLAVLYGIAPGLARGQLHPRAVPPYNALHRFWAPTALAIAAAAGLPRGYLVGALAWAAHVAFDRAIGLRLRSPEGFQRADVASEPLEL